MKILLYILAAIVVILMLVVVKTALVKPTSAKEAKVNLDNGPRGEKYGKILSAMVQKETISARNQEDRTKYLEFHKLLEELFPLVHENLEKHVFNGSLLFKWSGRGESEPIMLMSHHDVVEANGEWEHGHFSGDIDEQGRVWGRGTVDTKASLMCIFQSRRTVS